MTLIVIS